MIRVVALLTAAILISTAARMLAEDQTEQTPGVSIALIN